MQERKEKLHIILKSMQLHYTFARMIVGSIFTYLKNTESIGSEVYTFYVQLNLRKK